MSVITSIRGSRSSVVLGHDSYGQWFLVRRDRYGCELTARVFIGEHSPIERPKFDGSYLAKLEVPSVDLEDFEF